jgi:uncharacterized phage-associated protein
LWEGEQLFPERLEAWANGPVVRELYDQHRGAFRLADWPTGDPSHLTDEERESIDVVLEFYGKRSGRWLSELTHQEAPWRDARAGVPPGRRSNREITIGALAD